jgi:hypothetical protein
MLATKDKNIDELIAKNQGLILELKLEKEKNKIA